MFFLIITAQALWSPIHGDGSVYAWLTKEVAENTTSLLAHPLQWTRSSFFVEHPYLFFCLAAPIVKIFGSSDIGIKIPNYLVGFITLFLLFKIAKKRFRYETNEDNQWPAILACYTLVMNPLYDLMLRQPTLDPLAQLLSFISIIILLYANTTWSRKYFLSGMAMGFAFLTKGLELLPNLGALLIVSCIIIYKEKLNFFKLLSLILFGTFLPVLGWLTFDHIFWDQHWLKNYIRGQFTNRFFNNENTKSVFNLSYAKNFISKYFIQIIILIIGSWNTFKRNRSLDLFWWFTLIYIFLNITAFSIIKKDSSQHLTGIFLFTSVLIGPFLYDLFLYLSALTRFKKINKIFSVLHIVLLMAALGMWTWFMFHHNPHLDLWNNIKNKSAFFETNQNHLPIVIDQSVSDPSGIYFTAQWYWVKNKMYFANEASALADDQSYFLITQKNENDFDLQKIHKNK